MLNASKDTDADDELPIASRFPERSVNISDNEVPHNPTTLIPIRTTTTTTTTEMPATYKHWDWETSKSNVASTRGLFLRFVVK